MVFLITAGTESVISSVTGSLRRALGFTVLYPCTVARSP